MLFQRVGHCVKKTFLTKGLYHVLVIYYNVEHGTDAEKRALLTASTSTVKAANLVQG